MGMAFCHMASVTNLGIRIARINKVDYWRYILLTVLYLSFLFLSPLHNFLMPASICFALYKFTLHNTLYFPTGIPITYGK